MNEQLQISKDEWGPSEAKSNFFYIFILWKGSLILILMSY